MYFHRNHPSYFLVLLLFLYLEPYTQRTYFACHYLDHPFSCVFVPSLQCDPSSEGNYSLSRRVTNSFRRLTPRQRLAASSAVLHRSTGSSTPTPLHTRRTPLLGCSPTSPRGSQQPGGTTVIVNQLIDQPPAPTTSPVHLTTVYIEGGGYRAVVNSDPHVNEDNRDGEQEKGV